MGTLTYAAVMIVVFILAAFVFGYFETPAGFKKGLNSLDQGMKNLSNIKVLALRKKTNDPLTIGLSGSSNSNTSKGSEDLKIFVTNTKINRHIISIVK